MVTPKPIHTHHNRFKPTLSKRKPPRYPQTESKIGVKAQYDSFVDTHESHDDFEQIAPNTPPKALEFDLDDPLQNKTENLKCEPLVLN